MVWRGGGGGAGVGPRAGAGPVDGGTTLDGVAGDGGTVVGGRRPGDADLLVAGGGLDVGGGAGHRGGCGVGGGPVAVTASIGGFDAQAVVGAVGEIGQGDGGSSGVAVGPRAVNRGRTGPASGLVGHGVSGDGGAAVVGGRGPGDGDLAVTGGGGDLGGDAGCGGRRWRWPVADIAGEIAGVVGEGSSGQAGASQSQVFVHGVGIPPGQVLHGELSGHGFPSGVGE